jgi:hypothetical protein
MPKQADDLRSAADNYAAKHSTTELEFGGSWGVLFLIVWSHYILFYFWYGVYVIVVFDIQKDMSLLHILRKLFLID